MPVSPLTTNDVKHTINTQAINWGARGTLFRRTPQGLPGPQRRAPGPAQTLPSHLVRPPLASDRTQCPGQGGHDVELPVGVKKMTEEGHYHRNFRAIGNTPFLARKPSAMSRLRAGVKWGRRESSTVGSPQTMKTANC